MKKNLLTIVWIILLFLVSCKKDSPAVNVIIEGMVLNAETTQPVADAKIKIVTDNSIHTATSDETGYFNLGKYTIGDYTIIISREGFSTQTQQIFSANNLYSNGKDGYDVVKSVVCNLTPATEEAELTIYRKFEDGEAIAAQNFPYVISTGDINSTIEGTTDEYGRISLSNIPHIFTISIDQELNGIRYKTNSTIDIRKVNYLIVYGYSAEANLGIASTNILDEDGLSIQNFAVDGAINLQFTMPVDTANSKIDLQENAWYSIDISHQWSDNNMKLVITPTVNLKPGTLYGVDMQLVSPSGLQDYNNTIDFITNK